MDLHVVHVIPTLTTGGAERQLELLTARSAHRGTVVCLYEGGPVADTMRAAGRDVRVLGMRGWRKPLAPLRLARLLRRLDPDVVHVHLLAAQLWGTPAARIARVPVVVSSEHSLMDTSIEGRALSTPLRLLYRGLERLTTHTVAVSRTTALRLGRWDVPMNRITVVDNGIDVDALAFSAASRRSVRAELGIPEQAVVIGAVGRLVPVKRMDRVLRVAAPRLRAGGHVLMVAGTGPLLDELRSLADELGVAPWVRWLGPRSDMAAVLSAMDLVLSPSQDETFGLAVLEALSNGLPVVFAECPALDDVAGSPPWAVRIPPDTSAGPDEADERWRRALDALLADGPRRHPLPAPLRDRYGADVAASKVDEVYHRLTGVRAPGTRIAAR